jgi:hypothetical protein
MGQGHRPHPHGCHFGAWEKKNGQGELDVSLPEGADMDCNVILPDGPSYALTEGIGHYTWKK